MSQSIRQSDVRRVTVPVTGRCCVCSGEDTHHFVDVALGGPVCNECVAPLLNAESILQPRQPRKFHAQKR